MKLPNIYKYTDKMNTGFAEYILDGSSFLIAFRYGGVINMFTDTFGKQPYPDSVEWTKI